MKHIIYKLLLLLAVPVLTTSCIKEDYDDCDNVTIYFQYLADGDTDVLYQYMRKVDLYVFDEGGHLMGTREYNQDELSSFSAKPSFKLPAGRRYKVVAVGNAYDATEVVNLDATSFDNIFIQHPNWGNGDIVTNHDHNYLGQDEFFVAGGEGVIYRDTVTLYSSHINVHVEINGLPAPSGTRQAENIPISLEIENSNAQTSFTNEINEGETGTIYPDLIWDAERNCYRTDDLALFRMDSDGVLDPARCQHVLRLRGTEGNVLLEGPLYDYIVDNDDYIDVTKQEADLPIAINFNQTNVEIKLPAWVIEDITPGWE